jgi:hypothetical protein
MTTPTLRDRIKRILKLTGLDRWVSRAKYLGRLVIHPAFRRLEWMSWRDYFEWRRAYGATLGPVLYANRAGAPRALIVTKGTLKGTQVELGLIKGVELAGFMPVVLTDQALQKHYRLAGVTEFVRWEDFTERPAVNVRAMAEAATCIEDVMGFEYGGARVGKFALSTTFRSLRVGRLDFTDAATRHTLATHLEGGVARAAAARLIVDAVKPQLALIMGNRYTGQGELMDVCVERGVDVLTWFDAHRSSSLMLKRYRMENRDRHHGSISDESWALLQAMPWNEVRRAELRRELHDNYAAGDWYSRGGTQVNKRIVAIADLRTQLGLDPAKKTAVIFPHIVWDATLFWGTDLFNNYEDWLVETVRAACGNPRVNWVIKIHPAHVAKSAMERYSGEAAEITAIRRRVGTLPPHVVIIPPDTSINTYSLFSIMDYCLTVRGTIGIEAASFGIRVLTAGTGRYDHRGFTTDSETREAYLARIAAIETLPRLSAVEQELAERFAYGAFILRPFALTSISIAHERDVEATMRISVNARSSEELRRAPDLTAFAAWAADGRQEDFLADAEAVSLDRSA